MNDRLRWTGKTALVTGATSGIGRALATRLVAEGLRVFITGRQGPQVQALAKEMGPTVVGLEMDVTSEESVRVAMEAILARNAGLDVLVNNAGLGYSQPLLTGDTAKWREMLDVNILGLCITTREGVALMKGRPEGHVFHLGSMAGHRIAQGSNLYGATKYAVRALTESLRQELLQKNFPFE